MVTIKPIPITRSVINSIEIIQGQLLYCIDTLENYYDIAEGIRIQLSTVVQLSTDNSRQNLDSPSTDKMYIVIETNILYVYSGTQWIVVNTEADCTKFLYNADVLTPTTLIQNGVNQAPKTLASQVYFPDGSTAEEVVKQLSYEGKKITLLCKTEHVVIEYDKQRIIDVPYPTSTYDIYKYPVVVIWNDKYMDPSAYALGSEQMIFNDPDIATVKGDIITLIFSYAEVIANEGINADSINNVRFIVGPIEPADKRVSDIWIDTSKEELKQYSETGWDIIFKNNNTLVKRIKNTVVLSDSTDKVEIGISVFDKFRDTLLVFQNGILLDDATDYDVSDDGLYILPKDGLWEIDSDVEEYFYFVVLKNVPAYSVSDTDVAMPVDVAEDARVTQLEIKMEQVLKQLQVSTS